MKLVTAERLPHRTMTVAAEKLAQTAWIRLERKFGDFSATFRTGPVTLEHLPLFPIILIIH
ncbi:MAG: hypothetical protein WCX12_03675 [Candidatus Paceibacterota bacterium]